MIWQSQLDTSDTTAATDETTETGGEVIKPDNTVKLCEIPAEETKKLLKLTKNHTSANIFLLKYIWIIGLTS